MVQLFLKIIVYFTVIYDDCSYPVVPCTQLIMMLHPSLSNLNSPVCLELTNSHSVDALMIFDLIPIIFPLISLSSVVL